MDTRCHAGPNDGKDAERLTPAKRLFDFDDEEVKRERVARTKRQPLRLFLIRHGESAMNIQPHLIGGRSNSAALTAKGEAQAAALGRRLAARNVSFDQIFSSTALRARETSRIACSTLHQQKQEKEQQQQQRQQQQQQQKKQQQDESSNSEPRIVELDELLEICQGEWTGKERKLIYDDSFIERVERELCFLRPPGFSKNDCPPDGLPPAGESQWDVECRMAKFIDSLLEGEGDNRTTTKSKEADAPETIAVFSHGIAIKCFLRRILGASPSFATHAECANTSITELVYKNDSHNLDGWHVIRMNDASHLETLE